MCRCQDVFEGFVNVRTSISSDLLRSVGEVNVLPSIGGLSNLPQFRCQESQGVAIIPVVLDKLLF